MDSQVNPPRWTPSQSPTRTLLANVEPEIHIHDPETEGVGSLGSDHEDSLSFSNSTFNFAFSDGPTSQHVGPPARTVSHRPGAPLYIGGVEDPVVMEIIRSMEVERDLVERPEQLRRDEYVVSFNQNAGGGGGGRGGAVGLKGNGIFLTWKDLWVMVPDKKGGRRAILQGVTGYLEPGEVLAIMGPSGCGKSTLLDSLAGDLSNGTPLCISIRTPTSRLHVEIGEERETDVTIRDMGLQDSINTRIGGWGSKGLSGGQKRRVSICIEILTRPKLLFLDEPTSGLDSAASYHVMERIIKLAKQEQRTMVASIHQPSSEVFELFHNLCLLCSGRTVYFGSTLAANEFFSLNGFPCPPLRNPSDHYLRTINKDFGVDIEQGLGGRKMSAVEAINTLVKSYNSSEAYRQVQQRVFEICKQGLLVILKGGGKLEKKGSQAGFITQCHVLTRRSFVNMYRDLGYYWLRLAIYIALCLCVGTIFHDIGSSYGSIQARGSMLMFVASFLTFMAIGGFPSFVEDMKIFTRERLNGHYGVGAFVVGNTFSSLPYLFLISAIPGAMAYYLVGLQKGIGHFAYFVIMIYACMLLVESLMMVVASVVPDFLMGIITGAGIQGVMMLNGGFFRLPNDLPKPIWRYPTYYIAFHKYAIQGFFKNEFKGLTFPNDLAVGPQTITGDEILRNIWQVEMGHSKWVDVVVLLGMVVLYRLMFLGIIKSVEKFKPILKSLMAAPSKQLTPVELPYTTSPAN
ncbi:hypothetical protein RHGRI_030036 [Rhododendron griersonianum]|uniref:ABC transporter domain-containing protein n=1 Tax=Rhododendron griersonianum TaxID=479676 RepID=A0AAV6IPD7_9ERIC|nr:hypothetical protein RHGRI_030036 [Rhododendron griersonianum]